jgi:hypothetical protein
MCATEQAFAWVSALIINVAFVSLIAWGASTVWYVGFVLSAVYTVILFGLARFIDGKSQWDQMDDGVADESMVDAAACSQPSHHCEEAVDVAVPAVIVEGDHRNPPPSLRRMPVLPNLLYGLFALALGVTGYFLPMNLYNCYDFGYSANPQSGRWSTDLSSLPPNVRQWAEAVSSYNPNPTFAFLSGQNTTLFQGSDEDSNPTLWMATGRKEPIHFEEIQNPSQFVLTGSGFACFSAFGDGAPRSGNGYETKSVVGCSDGTSVETTMRGIYELQSPHDFYVDNRTLWFKDLGLYDGRYGDGAIIYSIGNYTSMQMEMHSTYTPPDNDADSETHPDCFRKQSTVAIFVSALPVVVSSVLLWIGRSAPSASITTYVGVSSAALFIYMAIVEEYYDMTEFWGYWLSISGALYVLILADLTHCKRRMAEPPLVWGVNFGSLAFFVGMILSTKIYELGNALPWILFNVLAMLPLALLGIAYNQVFLLVLCAVGWIMTTVRIASAISDALFDTAQVPIYFIVLAISGLLIAAAGWGLNKHQDRMRGVLVGRLERISLSRRIFPVESVTEGVSTEQHPVVLETDAVVTEQH